VQAYRYRCSTSNGIWKCYRCIKVSSSYTIWYSWDLSVFMRKENYPKGNKVRREAR